jgi:hypothetical protein
MNIYRKEESTYVIEVYHDRKDVSGRYGVVPGRIDYIVDEEDYKRVSMFRWFVLLSRGVPYANANIEGSGVISMHQLITSFQYKMVDHINRDVRDNRKSNLREASNSQNQMNKALWGGSLIPFKGVTLRKSKNATKYRARITVGGKLINIGDYLTAEEAAKAYDAHALKHFGEYARVNFTASPNQPLAYADQSLDRFF